MALPNAAERTQSDLAHLIHPLYHPTDHQEPRIWVEGHGAIMKDINGVEVIDGLGGLWNVNIGHGRRELAEAAMQQMSTLAYCSSYTGLSNLPAIELAERLSRYGLSVHQYVLFYQWWSRIERELRSRRRAFTGKRKGKSDKIKIISRLLAYHGVTMAAMSATGMPDYWKMFEPRVPDFVHIASPYPYRFEGGDATPARVSLPPICSKRRFCAKAPTRWRLLLPNQCRVLGGSLCRRTTIFRASGTFVTNMMCCS